MIAGRKRKRGWMVSPARRLPNAIDLWTIAEEDEAEELELDRGANEDGKAADARTIVFGSALGGLHFGYVWFC